MVGQWSLEMNHVAAIIGGFNSQQKHIGQNGVRFQLIPRARQEGAMKYLADNAFTTPKWALNAEILHLCWQDYIVRGSKTNLRSDRDGERVDDGRAAERAER